MSSIKDTARAYQKCFDFHSGQFHGDGVLVAAHLSNLCKKDLMLSKEPRGTDQHIDQAAILIAIGRRQVYDEIFSLLNMELGK